MVSKSFPNLKKGITLVEVIVVIFIVLIFFAILISDFPKIKRQFALSRATHKFSQNIRRAQDMALSGVRDQGQEQIKGYGIYVGLANNKEYIIYADTCQPNDYEYTRGSDCYDDIVDIIDISQEDSGVIITEINTDVSNSWASADFSPPNPTTVITTNLSHNKNTVEIVFALEVDSSIHRHVSVNTSGLIEVK